MTSDSAKWCPVHNTTHTINGLRLVTPQEAGYSETDKDGSGVNAVVMLGRKAVRYFYNDCLSCTPRIDLLIPLSKPRTTRPFRRGEVRLGWMFRHKEKGTDHIATALEETVVALGSYGYVAFHNLLNSFDRLTYDSEGREVLSEAGQVEEQS